jgi:hypothetical protein
VVREGGGGVVLGFVVGCLLDLYFLFNW